MAGGAEVRPYITAGRRQRAIYGSRLGTVAARPKVSDPNNPRCRGRIALDGGEIDFRYHPCEEWVARVSVAQGMKSEEIAEVLKRSEGDVIVMLADLLVRGRL